MANKNTKVKEEAVAYIGEKRANLLEAFTDTDWENYDKLNLDYSNQSYFVRGSKEALEKFEAFYLVHCNYEKPLYASYFLSEYIAHVGSIINTPETDDVSFAEKDVLFLYVHDNLLSTGNSEAWVFTTALNKITNRNRLGFRTIVLSERNVGLLCNSKELCNIMLGGSVENRDLSLQGNYDSSNLNNNGNNTSSLQSENQNLSKSMTDNVAY